MMVDMEMAFLIKGPVSRIREWIGFWGAWVVIFSGDVGWMKL